MYVQGHFDLTARVLQTLRNLVNWREKFQAERNGGSAMILVMYKNGRNAKVPAPLLDKLIRQGEITHFRRSDGWVQVCQDPLRRNFSPLYRGPEKRSEWRTHLE
jgi:hypothetical protein